MGNQPPPVANCTSGCSARFEDSRQHICMTRFAENFSTSRAICKNVSPRWLVNYPRQKILSWLHLAYFIRQVKHVGQNWELTFTILYPLGQRQFPFSYFFTNKQRRKFVVQIHLPSAKSAASLLASIRSTGIRLCLFKKRSFLNERFQGSNIHVTIFHLLDRPLASRRFVPATVTIDELTYQSPNFFLVESLYTAKPPKPTCFRQMLDTFSDWGLCRKQRCYALETINH